MHYVVQKNVFREENYDKIFDVLEKSGLSYEVVEFDVDGNVDVKTTRNDVFVFGSVRLARVCKEKCWFPGSFYGDNHDYIKYAPFYGDNLLNFDSIVQKFHDEIIWEPNEIKFIRPSKDSKAFVGKLFTKMKWEDLVENNKQSGLPTILTPDTPVQIATPKKIYKEARCWIVGGKVITSSYYKFHDNVSWSADVDPEGLEFAQSMVDVYQLAEAFVMDICLTPDGWKIVEINCINMSGFYQGDLQKLVMALEDYFNPTFPSIELILVNKPFIHVDGQKIYMNSDRALNLNHLCSIIRSKINKGANKMYLYELTCNENTQICDGYDENNEIKVKEVNTYWVRWAFKN